MSTKIKVAVIIFIKNGDFYEKREAKPKSGITKNDVHTSVFLLTFL
jgi:hypothetical protein